MNIYETREGVRLVLIHQKEGHWNRWGPFLSERAWGTVREDYSADGDAWRYFPHDHARSRTYRWNEDGLGGICDRHQYLCFALALWNGRSDAKERAFGLTGSRAATARTSRNTTYLDNTPSHSASISTNTRRPRSQRPAGGGEQRQTKSRPRVRAGRYRIFDEGRYFDIVMEYGKLKPRHVDPPQHQQPAVRLPVKCCPHSGSAIPELGRDDRGSRPLQLGRANVQQAM